MQMHAMAYDFVQDQIAEFGLDYVMDLSERGFVPYLTDRGWRWVLNTAQHRAYVASQRYLA